MAVRSDAPGRFLDLHPALLDVVPALAIGLPAAAILGRIEGVSSLPLIAAMTVPLVWRRRWPLAAYAAQCTGLVAAAVLVPQVAQFVLCFLAVLAGAYSLGRHGRSWPRSLAVVSASMAPGAVFGFAHGSPANALWFLQLLFAWGMGFGVRREIGRLDERAHLLLPAEPASADSEEPPGRPPASLSALTRRELEVLMLLARGHSNGELAGMLHIGEGTIKTHVSRILAKLELRDRVQAVVIAYESGLVRPRSGGAGAKSASRGTPEAANPG